MWFLNAQLQCETTVRSYAGKGYTYFTNVRHTHATVQSTCINRQSTSGTDTSCLDLDASGGHHDIAHGKLFWANNYLPTPAQRQLIFGKFHGFMCLLFKQVATIGRNVACRILSLHWYINLCARRLSSWTCCLCTHAHHLGPKSIERALLTLFICTSAQEVFGHTVISCSSMHPFRSASLLSAQFFWQKSKFVLYLFEHVMHSHLPWMHEFLMLYIHSRFVNVSLKRLKRSSQFIIPMFSFHLNIRAKQLVIDGIIGGRRLKFHPFHVAIHRIGGLESDYE